MSQPGQTSSSPIKYRGDDWFANIIEWVQGKLIILGIAVSLIATGFLVYYTYIFSGYSVETIGDAPDKVRLFQYILIVGFACFATGMTLMFWGDVALPLTLFLVAAAYFTTPMWLPEVGFVREADPERYAIVLGAMGAMAFAGLLLGIAAVILQAADVLVRLRHRAIYGAKGDLMKYGSGVQEEIDIRNVFMGKCWQLPFCRKFVRERCPIFHSRRTCWKERVGCMCEEQVIRGAMEDKVIPKDAVAAAKYIPYNTRLTPSQKAERCRQCVIYNEHQRHKYRLMVPFAFILIVVVYFAFHQPLLEMTQTFISRLDMAMQSFTFSTSATGEAVKAEATAPDLLDEFVLVMIMVFVFSQIMRVIEFSIFKLKI